MEEIEDMASIAKAMEYLSSDPSVLGGATLLDSSAKVKPEVATQNREHKVSAKATQPVAPPTAEISNLSWTEELANEGADIMANGDIDLGLSSLDMSSLQGIPGITQMDVPPAKDDKATDNTKIAATTPQPTTQIISSEQSTPNTYRDLHDSADGWVLMSDEEKEALMDREIPCLSSLSLFMEFPDNYNEMIEAHLQGLEFTEPSKNVHIDCKLGFYMDKMPHGIVDKQLAGIGATTLEIKSKRNSVIVFPTKILAYNKWQRDKTKLLYVGGKINEERDTTSIQEINDYLSDEKIAYKKFLVVADSLYKLLQIIQKERYKDYFLMIDEVDMIQSESNYRPRLESLIDHYFQFPPKNRCLVTATMREFSNPRLQQECRFDMSWENAPKRKINLYYTDNLNALTAQQIQSLPPAEKIVIAFNSIRHCRNIIKLLPDELQQDCAILCSDSSVEEAGAYYAELDKGDKLPKRINFITSCYFAGVDFEDSYHLISVSNARQNYQMLSPDKLTQIHGRCRIADGILSDTIIFNTREKWRRNADEDYQAKLIKQAESLLRLQQTASELGEQDEDMQVLFEIVKAAIRDKGAISISGEEPVRLTRRDIFKQDVVAYMNIDYLVERHRLSNTIYDSCFHLKQALEAQGHKVTFENRYGALPLTEQQAKIEDSNKEELQAMVDAKLKELIEELREITKTRPLTVGETRNLRSIKGCSVFVQRFYQLQEYADAETLLKHLWEIRHSDKRAYKNLRNAAVFWALDDKHPFKKELLSTFQIGKKYKASEIHNLIAPIVKYHLHKSIKQRAAVSLPKSLFLVERPKIYLIKGPNPMGFKEQGTLRIPKTEENLLKYFQIS